MYNFTKISKYIVGFIFTTIFMVGCSPQPMITKISEAEYREGENPILGLENNPSPNPVPVDLSFTIADSELVEKQPVIVVFTVKNASAKPVKIDLGANRKGGFLFSLTLPDGSQSKLPQLWPDGLTAPGLILIQPYKSYTQKLVLNQWTSFPLEGKYTLNAQLSNQSISSGSDSTLTFVISKKDTERLETICKGLFREIMEFRSFDEANEAASALSYVNDEVAIPYLLNVLTSNKTGESTVINTIGNQGGVVFAEVLMRFLKQAPHSQFAGSAKSKLALIGYRTTDIELKSRINAFLKT